MDDFDSPQNPVEEAIAAVIAAGEDPDAAARRAALIALATHNITVILPALTEDGTPPPNAEPLFVSDGPNLEQPMLAAFTRRERAEAHAAGEPCEIREIAGLQLFLGTPEDAGIMVNPNQPLCFRMAPELARFLREDVAEDIKRRHESRPPDAFGGVS